MKNFLKKNTPALALLLLAAGAGLWFWTKPAAPRTLQSAFFQPEKEKLDSLLDEIHPLGFAGPEAPQTREDSLAQALDRYGQGDFAAARALLEAYLLPHPDDLRARFYLGMSLLYLGESPKAFQMLSPLGELPAFDLRDDARWYAALAAANTDKTRSTGLFSSISHDPNSKYRDAATAVMNSILKNPDNFSFRIEPGQLMQGAIVVAAPVAWWQAGWVRALLALLFPAGGASLLFWRRRVQTLEAEKNALRLEKDRSDALLLNILPAETAQELKKYGHSETRRFEQVTVLFCDFKDFTKISETLPAEELVATLNECFEAYDRIVEAQRLEKIKTVGDCYICTGGLTSETGGAVQVVQAAQKMLDFLDGFNRRQSVAGKPLFEARIGIHTGPLVAGIVGIKKFAYDIWGDTVNIAARMEQASEGGRINLSGPTYELVKTHFPCVYRGKIEAKGKGAVDMYFVA